jgi:hypothetical protein
LKIKDIQAAVLKKLKVYTDNPQFEPSVVAKVSVAAKSLCMWVCAIQVYLYYYFLNVAIVVRAILKTATLALLSLSPLTPRPFCRPHPPLTLALL